ncbi:MAG: preprotein translocase subunit SecY [Candidatus Spechtbacteria bacterium RIFCSPLOWO2_12_FULL_38_22]|uniref:Protein translocase subunit SecY n=1 Tax=Candidatus Spechtbacteria bacterium RIFCSPLOWO2_12_FULL_38_22 TaxID=1802165 RepID=A0A1G2HIT6_9BACT|nr:MAG: preprotein translocase subunit SecY [Candidatus Spechtbacteria bacterium RIFCSPHIGHO2_01_FULL_38_11]OGZ59307.1 MAG: preprotein translocase subunit SecY [Candidatus Spechtbacteria bacterium RIFCSPHIGHO2_12_FULL_38_30]OGZ60487.1 MAG: preprotein translocase subunit SecY [Candidatus Spechtbacteria bacterium RIFCSPLOWO2_01_FULL_38_20]OGZ62180.1 MAG: preprotein translocase subunit SecY [Candidatus Spechtbacteria bacterium RIFCSPLOWO2_12_FULL_38_22]
MTWWEQIKSVFKIKELRNKVLFVLFVLGIFRISAVIPIPGIDVAQLRSFLDQNQFFGILNIFSGGALSNLSLVMLGLGPYITSTITLQLLTMIFPRLKEMYEEEGEQGKQKFNQYSRIFTVPLAVLQGWGLVVLFTNQGILGALSGMQLVGVLTAITAGAVWLMWLGELISEKGIGNGISLLIFAGIIASLPVSIRNAAISSTSQDIPSYIAFALVGLFIIATVIVVNEARRNVPISYAKQVRGNKVYGGSSTYLPMTLNPAGVIPIIFALSLILFPGILTNFFAGTTNAFLLKLVNIFNAFQNDLVIYSTVYFLLVVFFTYFYTAVTFNPDNIAQNLQRQGGFIPGIRPGPPTAKRIHFILNRTLLIGAIFLGFIAIVPSIVQGLSGTGQSGGGLGGLSFIIGGTSILILVSVVLETIRQVKSQIVMRQYE